MATGMHACQLSRLHESSLYFIVVVGSGAAADCCCVLFFFDVDFFVRFKSSVDCRLLTL